MTEKEHIGYVESNGEYLKIYAPVKGQIVTKAFIFCKHCSGVIYHVTGPKQNAVCKSCYDILTKVDK